MHSKTFVTLFGSSLDQFIYNWSCGTYIHQYTKYICIQTHNQQTFYYLIIKFHVHSNKIFTSFPYFLNLLNRAQCQNKCVQIIHKKAKTFNLNN